MAAGYGPDSRGKGIGIGGSFIPSILFRKKKKGGGGRSRNAPAERGWGKESSVVPIVTDASGEKEFGESEGGKAVGEKGQRAQR